MYFRNKLTLTYLLIFILTFSLVRFLFFITYFDYFSSLSATMILESFIDGLRFDISAIFTFAGLGLFLLNLPINSKIWLKSISSLNLFIYLCLLLILIGDLIYFDEVKRHLGDDLLLAIDDADFVIDIAIKEYWYLLITLSLIHIWRCRRSTLCRSRWSPYH